MKYFFFTFLFLLPWASQGIAQEKRAAKLFGQVLLVSSENSTSGSGLANVEISFRGGSTNTDASGNFDLPILGAFGDAPIYLTVRKEGYYVASSGASPEYRVSKEEREDFVTIKMMKLPRPEGKKRIAVVPFCDDTDGNAPLIDGAFTAVAAEALNEAKPSDLEAISHMQVWSAMRRNNLAWQSYCDPDQLVQLAEEFGANVVITGMYRKRRDGKWRLNCAFLDLTRKVPLYDDIWLTRDDLVSLQDGMYDEILKRLGVQPSTEGQAFLKSYTTDATQSEEAYTHYLQGAQYRQQGQAQEAEEEQQKALQNDPSFFRAEEERARSLVAQGKSSEAEAAYAAAQEKAKRKGILQKVWEKIKPPLPTHTVCPGEDIYKIAGRYGLKASVLIDLNALTARVEEGQSLKLPKGTNPLPCEGDPLEDFVFVKGGTFQMGSNSGDSDEKPVHSVTLSGFYIQKTEVTVGQYLAFCEETNSHWPKWLEEGSEYNVETGSEDYYKSKGYRRRGSENLPIVGVSWEDAKAYCDWLSQKTGKNVTLPTEAQWEYAARGGQNSKGYKYAGSDALEEVAWFGDNASQKPQPVGTKKPNELGLYDMSGNAWEWCADWYDGDYYQNSPSENPTGPSSGESRVLRGGSWVSGALGCHVAYRNRGAASDRVNNSGFRCAVSP